MDRTFLLCLICFTLFSFGVCGPTDKRGPKDLSDERHFEGEEHNLQYDHEAFLGKQEAKEFDKLSPEESKRRLGIIADKIDANQDGSVSHEELVNWIRHVGHRYMYEHVDNRFPDYDIDGNSKVTLEEYQRKQYGTIEDEDAIYDTHRQLSFKASKERDQRKFAMADENGDGELDREEFAAFLYPEDVPRMREIVITEAMEDIDKDRDGFVTVEEYINDVWPQWERDEAKEEPEWVQNEREQILKHRDVDGDQKLNREELANWVAPQGYDPAESEANHLMYHSDTDKDKQLTKREILDNMEYFVGSQATNYGTYLNRHDEF